MKKTLENSFAWIDVCPVAIFIAVGRRPVYMNPAAEQLTGYTLAEHQQMEHFEVVHPDFRSIVVARNRRRQEGDSGPDRYQAKLSTKGGQDLWVDVSAVSIRYKGQDAIMVVCLDVTEEKRQLDHEARFRAIFESEPECVKLVDADGRLIDMNRAGLTMIGASSLESVRGTSLYALIDPQYRAAFEALNRDVFAGNRGQLVFRLDPAQGRGLWLETVVSPLRDAQNNVVAALGVTRDITERVNGDRLRDQQNAILESIARGAELPDVMDQLIRMVESQSDGVRGSVMLADEREGVLNMAAAPSFPREFREAIDRFPIGPACGVCGTAAFRRERVIVTDALTDPLTAPFLDLVEAYSLRAAWSEPIIGSNGDLLGTFALYHRRPGEPTAWDVRLIESMAHLASIALERQRSLLELRDQSQTTQKLLETTLDCYLLADDQGTILDVNRSYCETIGYQRDELLTQNIRDVEAALDPEAIRRRIEQMRTTGGARFETRHRRKDGEVVDLEVSLVVIPGPNGSPLFAAFMRDITGRLRDQRTLRELYDKLAEAQRRARLGHWEYWLDDDRGRWSRQMFHLFHREPSLDVPDHFADFLELIHPEDRNLITSEQRQVIETGTAVDTLQIRTNPDNGPLRYLQCSIHRNDKKSDDQPDLTGTALDITPLKEAQLALAESEERFASLLACLDDVVWAATGDGATVLYLNEAVDRVYGIPREAALASPSFWFDAVVPEDRPLAQQSADQLMQDGYSETEYRIRHTNGEIHWLLDRKFIIPGHDGVPDRLGGIVTDVTQQKRVRDERRRLEDQLALAQRRSTMGEMASALAHELNQPLAALANYSAAAVQMIDRDGGQVDRLRPLLDQIAKQSERAGQVMRQIRAFVRQDHSRRAPVRLDQILEKVRDLLQMELRNEQVSLQMELDESRLWIYADEVQLQQVFVNLLRNAAQAMEQNRPEERQVRVAVKRRANLAVIAISDRGKGIPDTELAQVFTPFYTTKPDGLGMGLAICQGIVHSHDGTIAVTRNAGRGVTFHIEIPLIDPPSADSPVD